MDKTLHAYPKNLVPISFKGYTRTVCCNTLSTFSVILTAYMKTTIPLIPTQKKYVRRVPLPVDWEMRKAYLMQQMAAFPYMSWMDSCGSEVDRYGKYAFLAGIASDASRLQNSWEMLAPAGDWYMGGLPYELKNRFETGLITAQDSLLSWPEVAFFIPEIVLYQTRNSPEIHIESDSHEGILRIVHWIEAPLTLLSGEETQPAPVFASHFSAETYQQAIRTLQAHIKEGDFYEINLTQAFWAEHEVAQPIELFRRLIEISPVPFAAFLRIEDKYAICASPERFLQHQGGILRTQPIKGTTPRGKTEEEDRAYRNYLSHSEKEQAENVMIVDLSRNDLQRSCKPRSVHVPYLFEIQAFPQVYQLVSTVEGELAESISPLQAVSMAFPPGSMTGAPKVSTMHHIDAYEPIARGLYAGSIGYIAPNGDMDLNVVIRSLMYDAKAKLLSYHVGGAITYDSDPASEYEETLVKAQAIRKLWE